MKALAPAPRVLLLVNLVLGVLIAITNGGAFLVTVSGGRSHLGGQLGEVAFWAVAGFALLATSIVGMRRKSPEVITGVQAFIVIALSIALAATGLAVLGGVLIPSQAFVWTPGILSVLSAYGPVNYFGATEGRDIPAGRVVALAVVVGFVAMDIATFLRVVGQ
jgi:hypothetical protein